VRRTRRAFPKEENRIGDGYILRGPAGRCKYATHPGPGLGPAGRRRI